MNKCKICGQEWLVQHHCTKLAEHTTNQSTDSTKPSEREELIRFVESHACGGSYFNENMKRVAALLAEDGKAGGEVMNDEAKAAVKLAYGHLWHVNNEPAAPIAIYDTEKAAYEARRQLRGLLTDKERGEAINHVGGLIGRYENSGDRNAELAMDSNTAKPEQQRELAGPLAMGQPLGGGENAEPSNPKTQGRQHVATVVGADEYGPMLEWSTHWVELIGAKLYTRPQQEQVIPMIGSLVAEQAAPGAVQDDFVRVPKEPTLAMLDALRADTTPYLPDRYRAMIAAAPKAQEPGA